MHDRVKWGFAKIGKAYTLYPNVFCSNSLREARSRMKSPIFLSMLLTVVFAVSDSRSQSLPPSASGRPNILWITCEDTSPTLGCYGDSYAITPNLDALARQGVRYTAAFATASVCSPARSCLITGLYATSLGTQNLRSHFPVPAGICGFTAYLRQAGYFTSNNVKTDYNVADEKAFIQRAWDRCDDKAHWRLRKPGQSFFSVFNIMDTHQSRRNVWSFEQFEKEIGSKLSAPQRHDPAKVLVPPFLPDTPLVHRTLARGYDCETSMDQEVGRLLKQLDEDGLADNTIVFFYGDGGVGMPRGKRTLYDSGLQVPLILRFPAKFGRWAPAAAGQTTGRLVSFVDFAPTVLTLAGLPIPSYMQGHAFLGDTAAPPRQYVFGARDRVDEAFEISRSVRDARWLYIRNYLPHLSWMQPEGYSDLADMRREMVKLAEVGKLSANPWTYAAPEKPLEELYDCQADPQQLHNVAVLPLAEHRTALESMRRRLRDWMVKICDVGFLTEHEQAVRTAGKTPFDWARQPGAYPQDRILAAAELVGRPEAFAQQMALLADADSAVRYWGVVGLRAQGARAMPAHTAVTKMLDDRNASVRIEAAGVLVALDDTTSQAASRPLDVLTAELRGDDRNAALHAARTLELLGPRAKPVVAAMREMLAVAKKGSTDSDLCIQFALAAAIDKLDTPARK
jgi:N-sulfoglucosamine sulfohydrolase